MKLVKDTDSKTLDANKVSDKDAEEAFKTILTWLGEDPNREGLLETPKRVMKAYKEYFAGYKIDPSKILDRTFGDVDGYDDMVIQKNISIQSHCEHHMAPIIGKAHIGYISSGKVIGLSKLNRIAQYFAKRPQVQERLTMQIGHELQEILETKDVAVVITAEHLCVSSRGIQDVNSETVSAFFGGKFESETVRQEFNNYLIL